MSKTRAKYEALKARGHHVREYVDDLDTFTSRTLEFQASRSGMCVTIHVTLTEWAPAWRNWIRSNGRRVPRTSLRTIGNLLRRDRIKAEWLTVKDAWAWYHHLGGK